MVTKSYSFLCSLVLALLHTGILNLSSHGEVEVCDNCDNLERQGSLQLGGHGSPPNRFDILPNQKVTKFISLLYIIIRVMWLAPKVILLNHVDNKLFFHHHQALSNAGENPVERLKD